MEYTTSLVPLVYPQVLGPVFARMGKSNPVATTVQSKLLAAEKLAPGVCLDLIMGILKESDIVCNIHEAVLKLHGSPETDEESASDLKKISMSGTSVRKLVRQLTELKKILGRIPDQINGERTTFLITIKETAGTIKGILDTMVEVSRLLPNPSTRSLLELQKMDFVKYSKRFSMTLQNYFREGMEIQVYISALFIINQASVIILTMRQL